MTRRHYRPRLYVRLPWVGRVPLVLVLVAVLLVLVWLGLA